MKILILAGTIAAQGAGAEDPAAGRPWRTVDRPVVIVNQDLITASRLERDLRQYERNRPLTTDTERRAAERQILTDRVKERLGIQAGANLGVDERLIDRRVADSMERLRERENGVVGLARFLESRDISGPDVRLRLRDDIYGQLWTSGQTGEAPGPLGRVTVDRYVRPGALRFQYQQALLRPAEVEALGGSVGLVRFQQIVLDPARLGGLDAAREEARSLAQRVAAGEDMAELARLHGGDPGSDGVTEVEEARLAELFPEIASFTARATPGEISTPIASEARGRSLVRVVRFLERRAPVEPEFRDAQLQGKLRQTTQNRLEQYRLESAYAALLRGSYVWPPELAGRKP
ncbi:MAG: peptidylprolyl isomerase [Planctomycetes bacterium]|nr:peptidylprolyl isomerase [Planctomycetota bacterium]